MKRGNMNLTLENAKIEKQWQEHLEAQQTEEYFKIMKEMGIIILNKLKVSPEPLLKAVGLS
jgi:hypothetical protein